jgi:hypothetical protein
MSCQRQCGVANCYADAVQGDLIDQLQGSSCQATIRVRCGPLLPHQLSQQLLRMAFDTGNRALESSKDVCTISRAWHIRDQEGHAPLT